MNYFGSAFQGASQLFSQARGFVNDVGSQAASFLRDTARDIGQLFQGTTTNGSTASRSFPAQDAARSGSNTRASRKVKTAASVAASLSGFLSRRKNGQNALANLLRVGSEVNHTVTRDIAQDIREFRNPRRDPAMAAVEEPLVAFQHDLVATFIEGVSGFTNHFLGSLSASGDPIQFNTKQAAFGMGAVSNSPLLRLHADLERFRNPVRGQFLHELLDSLGGFSRDLDIFSARQGSDFGPLGEVIVIEVGKFGLAPGFESAVVRRSGQQAARSLGGRALLLDDPLKLSNDAFSSRRVVLQFGDNTGSGVTSGIRSSIGNVAPNTSTVTVFRKMSLAEAKQTLATQKLQPRIAGSHGQKFLSESLHKVRTFHNKGVASGTKEVIIAFEMDAKAYSRLRASAIPQQGSSGSGKIIFNTEGLKGTPFRNLGVPGVQLESFNEGITGARILVD